MHGPACPPPSLFAEVEMSAHAEKARSDPVIFPSPSFGGNRFGEFLGARESAARQGPRDSRGTSPDLSRNLVPNRLNSGGVIRRLFSPFA